MKKDILEIIKEGIKSVDPLLCINRSVRLENDILVIKEKRYDLREFENIYIVGAGKASAKMAFAMESILGDKKFEGVVITKYKHLYKTRKIKVIEASHPIPDENGIRGTKKIIELLEKAKENDLVIVLISGGGSSLLVLPKQGISLEEKKKTDKLLLECGADIEEVNTVRKHISQIKGGLLAKKAYPAEVVSLILSDVLGDPIDAIASGPTSPDPTTIRDAIRVLERYDLKEKVPKSIITSLKKGETPKPKDKIFKRVSNFVIGNNKMALESSRKKAEELGYNTLLLSSYIEGEAKEVGKVLASIAKEIYYSDHPLKKPAAVISGGETTVTIRGNGRGGRNQELVLSAAIQIRGLDICIASLGTDGTDGMTDAAGAIVDGNTIKIANKKGLEAREYLDNNDSYSFFKAIDSLVYTGPTNTNVNDIQVILVK